MEKKATIDRAIPKGYEIKQYDEYLQITRTWLGRKTIIAVISVISSGFFLALFISGKGTTGIESELGLLLMKVFLSVVVLASIYYAITTLVNKTQIYVSKKAIEIKHQPIPWFGNKRIETSSIKQLFTKRHQDASNNRGSESYYVNVLTNEHQEIYLLSGFNNRDEALYIEQEIEKYLGIENVKVRGEDW